MLIHTPSSAMPLPSEITPEASYTRRQHLRHWLAATGATATLASMGRAQANPASSASQPTTALTTVPNRASGGITMETPTAYADATGYNNFYEFGTDKSHPARYGHTLATSPWSVSVEGLVHKPRQFDLDALLRLAPLEERIYRLRCVEGWSMVIPWVGYPLARLIEQVQPLGSARYVEFITLADKARMPGLQSRVLHWPYTEGLRLDEALHPLTLLTLGMYGKTLPPQNGAPVRLVVPWKYGFKSAKSLVAIRFVEHQPATAWNKAARHEYGFYSNVNPGVPHPRWSQASERRIGEDGLFSKKRPTLLFNGYEAQVGQLYAGMDLKTHF